MEEGCLSVRSFYGKVKRSKEITIEAYNEKGEKKKYEARGLLAQIFQHEIDHLQGILFIDKAKYIQNL
jgi:peptide deformylase